MSNFLFNKFDKISPEAWKQKIQVDLKGADYNETLLWHSEEGVVVKPFYTKEDRNDLEIKTPNKGFNICQSIFVDDIKIANSLAIDAINRGATAIHFKASKPFDPKTLLKGFPGQTPLYFQLSFLDADFQIK